MTKRPLVWLVVLACISLLACSPARFAGYRVDAGAAEEKGVAESVILFIGDGMGPQIVSIAKIYSERSLGAELNMVKLANSGVAGYMTTHSEDALITDSAASATAMATGFKTNNGFIGMSPDGRELKNLFEKAVDKGKSVGVVTTTSVTHATPACFLAHAPSRNMHFEIARQIVEGIAGVVMGGGYRFFLPPDRGKRPDGKDLTEEARKRGFEVVFNRHDLENFRGERLLGLFAPNHLPYERSRDDSEIPSLSEMTQKAIEVLSADPDGFLLVVEGGRIDHAEHEKDISDALGDFLAFDTAIGRAMDYQTGDSRLIIIVSADHDTGSPAITATDAGYPSYDDLERLVGESWPYVGWVSGNHTGTMVPIFARGPGVKRFSGVRDNTDMHDNIVWVLGL